MGLPPKTLPADFDGFDPAPKGAAPQDAAPKTLPLNFEQFDPDPVAAHQAPAVPPVELKMPTPTAIDTRTAKPIAPRTPAPPAAEPAATIAPYRPGLVRRTQDWLGTTAPVQAMQGTPGEQALDLLGIYPSGEPVEQRNILGHPGETLITNEEARTTTAGMPIAGMTRGVLEGGASMTHPEVVTTMVAAAATGGLLSPAIPAIGRLISLGFSAQAANDLVKQVPDMKQMAEECARTGDWGPFYARMGRLGFDMTMLVQMGSHAAGQELPLTRGVPGDAESTMRFNQEQVERMGGQEAVDKFSEGAQNFDRARQDNRAIRRQGPAAGMYGENAAPQPGDPSFAAKPQPPVRWPEPPPAEIPVGSILNHGRPLPEPEIRRVDNSAAYEQMQAEDQARQLAEQAQQDYEQHHIARAVEEGTRQAMSTEQQLELERRQREQQEQQRIQQALEVTAEDPRWKEPTGVTPAVASPEVAGPVESNQEPQVAGPGASGSDKIRRDLASLGVEVPDTIEIKFAVQNPDGSYELTARPKGSDIARAVFDVRPGDDVAQAYEAAYQAQREHFGRVSSSNLDGYDYDPVRDAAEPQVDLDQRLADAQKVDQGADDYVARARQELGPEASISQVLMRAQELQKPKAKAAAEGGEPKVQPPAATSNAIPEEFKDNPLDWTLRDPEQQARYRELRAQGHNHQRALSQAGLEASDRRRAARESEPTVTAPEISPAKRERIEKEMELEQLEGSNKLADRTRADEIRAEIGLTQKQLEEYDPAKAVTKLGNRFYYKTVEGKETQHGYKTKREAIEAARQHKELKQAQYDYPEGYFDLSSLRAGKRLDLAAKYQREGMSEMEAWERVRRELPDEPAKTAEPQVEAPDLEESPAVTDIKAGKGSKISQETWDWMSEQMGPEYGPEELKELAGKVGIPQRIRDSASPIELRNLVADRVEGMLESQRAANEAIGGAATVPDEIGALRDQLTDVLSGMPKTSEFRQYKTRLEGAWKTAKNPKAGARELKMALEAARNVRNDFEAQGKVEPLVKTAKPAEPTVELEGDDPKYMKPARPWAEEQPEVRDPELQAEADQARQAGDLDRARAMNAASRKPAGTAETIASEKEPQVKELEARKRQELIDDFELDEDGAALVEKMEKPLGEIRETLHIAQALADLDEVRSASREHILEAEQMRKPGYTDELAQRIEEAGDARERQAIGQQLERAEEALYRAKGWQAEDAKSDPIQPYPEQLDVEPDPKKKLVIIACSDSKIWKKNPDAYPEQTARDAYEGQLFQKHMRYAEEHGADVLILSAKYGLINPDHVITDYNAKMAERPSAETIAQIRAQAELNHLGDYGEIEVLGGKGYERAAIEAIGEKVKAPFAGKQIGERLRDVKKAIDLKRAAAAGDYVFAENQGVEDLARLAKIKQNQYAEITRAAADELSRIDRMYAEKYKQGDDLEIGDRKILGEFIERKRAQAAAEKAKAEPIVEDPSAPAPPSRVRELSDEYNRLLNSPVTAARNRRMAAIDKELEQLNKDATAKAEAEREELPEGVEREIPEKADSSEPVVADPEVAEAIQDPKKLEALKAELEGLKDKRNRGYQHNRERLAHLEALVYDAEQAVKRSGYPKLEPPKGADLPNPVSTDPKAANAYRKAYFTAALDQVRQAWRKRWPGTDAEGKETWAYEDFLTSKHASYAEGEAMRPEEFKQEMLRIEVPGDGKFLIKNNPKVIERIFREIPRSFDPQKLKDYSNKANVRPYREPKATEADRERWISTLKDELEDIRKGEGEYATQYSREPIAKGVEDTPENREKWPGARWDRKSGTGTWNGEEYEGAKYDVYEREAGPTQAEKDARVEEIKAELREWNGAGADEGGLKGLYKEVRGLVSGKRTSGFVRNIAEEHARGLFSDEQARAGLEYIRDNWEDLETLGKDKDLEASARLFEAMGVDREESTLRYKELEKLGEWRANKHNEQPREFKWKKGQEPADLPKKGKGGTRLYSGLAIADPEVWKEMFPDAGEMLGRAGRRIRDAFDDSLTSGDLEKGLIRQKRGALDAKKSRMYAELDEHRKRWQKRSAQESLEFIDAIEKGGRSDKFAAIADPAERALAERLTEMLDARRDRIRHLKPGALENFIQDYFPHVWESPAKARQVFDFLMGGKRPLEGPKNFLKHRTIPTTAEGIAKGLKPVTYNPVDLAMLKVHEMDRFIMAHELMDLMKRTAADPERLGDPSALKMATYAEVGSKREKFLQQLGWKKYEDRVGTVYGSPEYTIPEYLDRNVKRALGEVMSNLGIQHQRGLNRPKGTKIETMGRSWQGGDRIETRANSPLSVAAHELMHQLDHKFGIVDQIVNAKETRNELRQLADLTYEGADPEMVPASFKKYVRSAPEKVAHVLEMYVSDKSRLRQEFPKTYKWLEDFITKHDELEPLAGLRGGITYDIGANKGAIKGMVIRGYYYGPPEAVSVFNRHLSPGLVGKSRMYDAYRHLGNTLNQAQLGLSLFHAGFTSLDAMTSDVALGLEQLSRGNAKGFKAMARGLFAISPIENAMLGHKIYQEVLKPESYAEVRQLARAVEVAGGRVEMDPYYKNEAIRGFQTALKDGRLFAAARRSIPAFLEMTAKPVMEWLVPRQKLGVFGKMTQDILERARSEQWEDERIRQEVQKAWDSVDNRMGQIVYDNLFWNRVVKDLSMASVRSLGWNIGTIREIGGGARDFAVQGSKLAQGGKAEMSHRMAYVMALPLVVGFYGALYHTLSTGEKPQELKDYFFPKGPDGNRVSLPAYMKDIYAWRHHPLETAGHKAHPMISLIVDMIKNRDFYGNEIRNEDDPLVKQAWDSAKYTLKGSIPLGIRNMQQAHKQGESWTRSAQNFVGITPAPSYINHSDAYNLAVQYSSKNRGEGTRTQAQAAIRDRRKDLEQQFRTKSVDKEDLKRRVQAGELTIDDVKEAVKASRQDPLPKMFSNLPIEQALNVFEAATPEEKKQLIRPLMRKSVQLRARPGEDGKELKQRWIRAIRGAKVAANSDEPVVTLPDQV